MKNRVAIMWVTTAICFILTIVFWFLMNNVNVEYKEVSVVVTDTATRQVINKSTQNRTTFYEVKVEYNGKEYELQNVHGLTGYSKGRTVKALLSNDKLYANVEGIKSTSPMTIVYFIFLFGTFGMLMLSATISSREKAKSKKINQMENI